MGGSRFGFAAGAQCLQPATETGRGDGREPGCCDFHPAATEAAKSYKAFAYRQPDAGSLFTTARAGAGISNSLTTNTTRQRVAWKVSPLSEALCESDFVVAEQSRALAPIWPGLIFGLARCVKRAARLN